jgi:hypothetical protein
VAGLRLPAGELEATAVEEMARLAIKAENCPQPRYYGLDEALVMSLQPADAMLGCATPRGRKAAELAAG